jgi:hypothetical protein
MPEKLLSRWVRLKRSSQTRRRLEPINDGPPVDAVAPAGTEAPSGDRQDDGIIDEPFDPASLPSIETITVTTDIRGFLQSQVPVELARAALRQAWASDPAIRDFIGVAENQWDFNDPNAMPGFGPLQQADNLTALLAQALGSHGNFARGNLEKPASIEQSSPAAADHEAVALDRNPPQTLDGSPPDNNINTLSDMGGVKGEAGNDAVAEDPPRRRSHGSALPWESG